MKLGTVTLGLVGGLMMGSAAHAAFVVNADTTDPNFSFGGDTTSASSSIASAAVGAGSGSLFGGNGATLPDAYVFTYTPGTDVDNFSPAAGSLLGSTTGFGTETASGLVGGGSGLYNVYLTVPPSENVNPAGSKIIVEGDSGTDIEIAALDLNNGGTGADLDPDAAFVGGANNAWYLLGTVELTAGVSYSVTMEANVNSFVSQRAAAVMWEAVPEPATASLLGLGALAMLRRRSA